MFNKLESLVGAGAEGRFDRQKFVKVLQYYNINDRELCERIFHVVDERSSGYISFEQLVSVLCDFQNAPRKRQLDLLFRLVDQDGGGHVGVLELFQFILTRLKNVQRDS